VQKNPTHTLSKSGWSLRAEHLLVVLLGDAVGEGELQVLLDELLDVGALDVVDLLELNDAEDLSSKSKCQ
jgi:hypothetical protein